MNKFLQFYGKELLLLMILINNCSTQSFGQTNVVDIGKSFVNLSKLSTGGTFNPGDTLEIRVTLAVANVAPSQITAVQLFDTVPAKTIYVNNSLRTATNEGINYKTFTDASDADAASITGGNVLMNLGTGATNIAGGTIKNIDRPSNFGTTCILVACYKVRINPAALYGDTIKIGGKVTYKISGVTNTRNFNLYQIGLTQLNNSPCSNGTSISAASDSLGTFASGTVQNRATALGFATTYTKQNLTSGAPQDYYYSIANNSSGNGSTNPNSALPDNSSPSTRVFNVWDISGDHTGASNPTLGNPPVAPGTRGGYMVLINASYKTDTAYRETLINLCPNTYYEFSAWFRNICSRCGCDSTGKSSGTAGYLPGPGNDSSGVKPNLSFEIDGLAYFTTGDIKYSRSTPWKKYGFTFLTKPTQTTASFLIRNNSPGGGGNDWALDDIKVSHCGPSQTMNYNPFVLGCNASPFVVSLSDTIRYLFSNSYVYYKWQKSNVGGTIYTDLTGPGTSGTGTPLLVGGQYQFVSNLPSFLATAADSGIYYRVMVATSASNLASNCAFNDGSATMLKVINCGVVLTSNFIKFNGQLNEKKATLAWQVDDEKDLVSYSVEKSFDGINFVSIGFTDARKMKDAYYVYTDSAIINGNVYYRLKMSNAGGLYKYSTIVLLSVKLSFEVNNLKNPFNNNINANVIVPREGKLSVTLFSDNGQLVKMLQVPVNRGMNYLNIELERNLRGNGIYTLSIEFENEVIRKKLIKVN